MSGLLAELAEKDADGEKAAIYAQMKRLGGVPMVALIFRHLATLPGALEWLWDAVGPAWHRGELQERAWKVAGEAPLAPLVPIPRAALACLGVDAQDEAAIRDVLAAYNRANPENLLTVLCVLRMLEGHAASSRAAAREWHPPMPPGSLLPMVDVAAMSPELSALLDLVAAPGTGNGPRVVQSLYRHLAQRPPFLALAVTLLRPRLVDGSLDAVAVAVREAMAREADDIVAGLDAPPAPHPGIATICARFGGIVIPQMIVAGILLDRALP